MNYIKVTNQILKILIKYILLLALLNVNVIQFYYFKPLETEDHLKRSLYFI